MGKLYIFCKIVADTSHKSVENIKISTKNVKYV